MVDSQIKAESIAGGFVRAIGAFAPWVLGGIILIAVGDGAGPFVLVWAVQLSRVSFTSNDLLTAAPLDLFVAFSVHLAVITTVGALVFCGKPRVTHCLTFVTFGLLSAELLRTVFTPQTRHGATILLPSTIPFFFCWAASFVVCAFSQWEWFAQRKRPPKQP